VTLCQLRHNATRNTCEHQALRRQSTRGAIGVLPASAILQYMLQFSQSFPPIDPPRPPRLRGEIPVRPSSASVLSVTPW